MGCCGGGHEGHNMNRNNNSHSNHNHHSQKNSAHSKLVPTLLFIAAIGALAYYFIR